jgi:hypothetical protein
MNSLPSRRSFVTSSVPIAALGGIGILAAGSSASAATKKTEWGVLAWGTERIHIPKTPFAQHLIKCKTVPGAIAFVNARPTHGGLEPFGLGPLYHCKAQVATDGVEVLLHDFSSLPYDVWVHIDYLVFGPVEG